MASKRDEKKAYDLLRNTFKDRNVVYSLDLSRSSWYGHDPLYSAYVRLDDHYYLSETKDADPMKAVQAIIEAVRIREERG